MTVSIERKDKTWVVNVGECLCSHAINSHQIVILNKDGQIRCNECPPENSICARIQL